MPCPSLAETNGVRLYYAVDPDPTAAIPATVTWQELLVTAEGFDLGLSSSVSEAITNTRSYAGSILTKGEVSGNFNFELGADSLDDLIIAALQDSTAFGGWSALASIKNGTTKACLMFMKSVEVGATTTYYFYRGVQVDGLTLSMQPGAIVTGSMSFLGLQGETPLEDISGEAGWTLTPYTIMPLIESGDGLSTLRLAQKTGDVTIPATFQNLELSISNQMRRQEGIGNGIYSQGVASSRIMITASGSVYFPDKTLYDRMVADDLLTLQLTLEDANADGYTIDLAAIKAQSGVTPMAGGVDQDLLISPSFQAFEDSTDGSIKITKL